MPFRTCCLSRATASPRLNPVHSNKPYTRTDRPTPAHTFELRLWIGKPRSFFTLGFFTPAVGSDFTSWESSAHLKTPRSASTCRACEGALHRRVGNRLERASPSRSDDVLEFDQRYGRACVRRAASSLNGRSSRDWGCSICLADKRRGRRTVRIN
jgi:hypothetical protein